MNLHKKNPILAAIFVSLLLFQSIETLPGQSFENLNFEQQCDTTESSLCHWDLSWSYMVKIEKRLINENSTLLIEGENESSIGFVEQTSLVKATSKLKIVTFSGKIKTKNVEGKGAGLSISILDELGNYLFSEYMGNNTYKAINGSSTWNEFTIQAILDQKSSSIKIGGILNGKGKAWFDDFKVNIELLENRQPNNLTKKYINHVCKIIEENSLMRDSIDLEILKTEALKIAGHALKYSDCHLAVQYLIRSLGDHHSFLMLPELVKDWQDGADFKEKIEFAKYRMIDSFGYISVPGFHSNHIESKRQFADTIHHALKHFDQLKAKGWIIDLRNNDGGNMEPMLAGLGPLLNSDTLGFLIDVNGIKEPWGYKNGAPFSGNEIGVSASLPIKIINQNLPIAVLTGPKTGSSGEIIVISFIKNKNTKSFGKPTYGISTGNCEFDLLDGAKLFLTSTVMADRTGKKYGGKIKPDYLIETSNDANDTVLMAALQWLGEN